LIRAVASVDKTTFCNMMKSRSDTCALRSGRSFLEGEGRQVKSAVKTLDARQLPYVLSCSTRMQRWLRGLKTVFK
jgi:hypothetical protein